MQLTLFIFIFIFYILFYFWKFQTQLATLTNQIQNPNYNCKFGVSSCINCIMILYNQSFDFCCYHHMMWHVPLVTSHICDDLAYFKSNGWLCWWTLFINWMDDGWFSLILAQLFWYVFSCDYWPSFSTFLPLNFN